MKCKNCNTELDTVDQYCSHCGAKVINERITLKYLFTRLLLSLGWDSRFWLTFRDLLIKPGLVFDKYITGTRKRYTDPFTFFAIVATINVLLLGFYNDKMVEIVTGVPYMQSEIVHNPVSDEDIAGKIEEQNNNVSNLNNQSFLTKAVDFIFKYNYYFSFILLPFYAFIAFLVFGKPNNFAEHLVINFYVLGFASVISFFLLFITLVTNMNGVFIWGNYMVMVVYYLYSYQNYRGYSIKQLIVKFFRFIFILLFLAIIFTLVIFLVAIIGKILNK